MLLAKRLEETSASRLVTRVDPNFRISSIHVRNNGLAIDKNRKKICLIQKETKPTTARILSLGDLAKAEVVVEGEDKKIEPVFAAIAGTMFFGVVGNLFAKAAYTHTEFRGTVDLVLEFEDPSGEPIRHKVNFYDGAYAEDRAWDWKSVYFSAQDCQIEILILARKSLPDERIESTNRTALDHLGRLNDELAGRLHDFVGRHRLEKREFILAVPEKNWLLTDRRVFHVVGPEGQRSEHVIEYSQIKGFTDPLKGWTDRQDGLKLYLRNGEVLTFDKNDTPFGLREMILYLSH